MSNREIPNPGVTPLGDIPVSIAPDLYSEAAAVESATEYLGGGEQLGAIMEFAKSLPDGDKATIQDLLSGPRFHEGISQLVSRAGASLPEAAPFANADEHLRVREQLRAYGRDPNADPVYQRRLAATSHHTLGAI